MFFCVAKKHHSSIGHAPVSLYFSHVILTWNLHISKRDLFSVFLDSNEVASGVEVFSFTYIQYRFGRLDTENLAKLFFFKLPV